MKTCEICGSLGSYGTTNTICLFCGGIKESTSSSKGLTEHHICDVITQIERTVPGAKSPVIMMRR